MPGTVRKIIERIKERRSGGNSVVALTVETRLVLQGFDPERYAFDTPDDPGRLARISEIAGEMDIDIADLLESADAAPDPEAAPAAPPEVPDGSSSAAAAARTAAASAPPPGSRLPTVASDHPLRRFQEIADATLTQVGHGEGGSSSGASFATLIKSSALMALYSIKKDEVFCDLLRYDVLFQWFLGLTPEQAAFDAQAFLDDREKALTSSRGRAFFDRMVPAAGREKLFSQGVFQVDPSDFKSWMTPRGDLA